MEIKSEVYLSDSTILPSSTWKHRTLDNVPGILGSMTELAASDTCTQAETADTDRIILVLIRKVIVTLGHRTNEYADALFWTEVANVIPNAHDRSVERQRDLATVWRQVVGNRVLDDLEQLLL